MKGLTAKPRSTAEPPVRPASSERGTAPDNVSVRGIETAGQGAYGACVVPATLPDEAGEKTCRAIDICRGMRDAEASRFSAVYPG